MPRSRSSLLIRKIIVSNSILSFHNCFVIGTQSQIFWGRGIGLINSITIALNVVIITGFVSEFGVDALAGYGLGSRLELMLVPIAFGIGYIDCSGWNQYWCRSVYKARIIAKAGAFVTYNRCQELSLL